MDKAKCIKIVTDIFDDEKMLLIDDMPRRDAILVIWFKLLCLAGKQNNGGVFVDSNNIAYTDEMLATIFHRPLKTVQLALETFEKYGMIEITGDTITIPKWSKHQTLDADEKKKQRDRLYQAKAREKRRTLLAEKSSDNRLTSDDSSSDVRRLIVTKEERTKEENEQSESNINIYNNNNSLTEFEDRATDEETPALPAAQEDCPFRKIKDLYHSVCVSFPKIRDIDGNRKIAVAARWRAHKSLETFEELFRIAEASAFLKGQNGRNWSADFDWLMKATNFTKVLEHKYDGRDDGTAASTEKAPPGSFDTDEFFNAALARK